MQRRELLQSKMIDFGLELLPPDSKWFEHNLKNLKSLEKYFSTLWICDHFQYGGSMPWYEGWTSLTYLAAKYPQFKFGNLVLSASYRNPAMLAKMASTFQYLSGGRLILGIGAGWQKEEYEAYGFDFPSYHERIDRLEEAVQIIKFMWTNSPASFRGKYYHIKDAYCDPKPKEKIPLLIAVGGNSRALGVVARFADMYNEAGRIYIMKPLVEKLARACSEIGRDAREIKLTCILSPLLPEDPKDFKKDPSNTILGPNVEEVIQELKELANIGVSHFQVRCLDSTSLKRFCEEIIPALAKI
jgi:alkanesulfonate monooxygenase SsuD/methylene tetrahydromethanopterin reductase-like flavin-dependent oxidoreductase (luciferase family)